MKTQKKIITLVIALIMLFTAVMPGFTAFAASCNCKYPPLIYIKGRTNIYKDPSLGTDSENLAETNFSGGEGSIVEAGKNISLAFAKALITDEWDEYCDILFEEIAPVYDQYKLSDDGEVNNKSGIDLYWELEPMIERAKSNAKYHKNQRNATMLQFQYDMRLDPCVNAATLNEYIEAIKTATGHDKVNILARCEGCVIANAYFNIYGYGSVKEVNMFNSIANGAEIADDVYTNSVNFDAEAMNRFVNTFIDTSPVLDFVKATVNLVTFNGLLDTGLDFIDDIYNKISANLMPRLIREVFGTCPGWWGMVSPEAFEKAKAFVLEGNADGRFDKLVEKIDNYNYNYKVNAVNILEEMQENGVEVHIMVKYGSQMYPVTKDSTLLGDGVVSVYKQSYKGATVSTLTDKLSDDYIAQRVEAGFGKHISADHMVDASTAPFYEHTWYFKELEHHTYPAVVDDFIVDIFYYDGYADVDSFAEKPQFMYYEPTFDAEGKDIGVLHPLTEENKDLTEDTTNTSSRYIVLIKFLTALFSLFAFLFNK